MNELAGHKMDRKAPGKAPRLNDRQTREVYQLVVGKNPRQIKFEIALWTRAMVREMIRSKFGVNLSLVSVGRHEGKHLSSRHPPAGIKSI